MHFTSELIVLTMVLTVLEVCQGYVNIALNKPTYQQYPYKPGDDIYDSSNAVDGLKTNLDWNGGQCVYSDYEETATWWVNLTSIHSIHHTTIYFRTDSFPWGPFASSFLGFSVYISNTTDKSQGILCFKDNNFNISTIPAVFNTSCPVHGQYVIYFNERLSNVTYPKEYSIYAQNNLCEVEVYGCPAIGYYGTNCSLPCPDANCQYCHIETGTCQGCKPGYQGHRCELVNVALNKPTYQQYPYKPGDDIYDSSNAVDGLKTDLTWNGGQCVYSEYRETATWWVNLTSIHSIHHTTIYFRTDSFPWGPYASSFLGFSVYISNTTDKSQGILCFKDNIFDKSTIPAVFTTSCPVYGQYVIYYNERLSNVTYSEEYSAFAQNNLCEVEVYGCPAIGYYGTNCSLPCPDANCQYCHIETGACQGCKPGYQGHHCELVCRRGFFGQNCINKCNDTCNGCNTVNGLCDFGCLPGWKGDSCHKACSTGSYGIECNETCGNCHDVEQCSNTNGSCLTGCDDGYQGDLCRTRLYIFTKIYTTILK